MPRVFAVEETLARPADEVWQALTDWSSAHRWMAGVDWLKAEGEPAVGIRITFHSPAARIAPPRSPHGSPAGRSCCAPSTAA